jgi:hypothetical protein
MLVDEQIAYMVQYIWVPALGHLSHGISGQQHLHMLMC